MHWQRALEWLILHETRESGSSHAAELVSCWRAWPDASGTWARHAPREPLRRGLSERPPRRERAGERKMWGRGERRISFAGKTGTDSVVHTHPYAFSLSTANTYTNARARWLLVLRYYWEYAVSCRYSITRSRFSNRSNRYQVINRGSDVRRSDRIAPGGAK